MNKKISKQDLNRRALQGARITQLKPPKPTEEELKAAIARVNNRQESDFAVLAEAIEQQSDHVVAISSEVRELKQSRGAGQMQMKIHRVTRTRLINHVDVMRVTADGKRRGFKIDVHRDELGQIDTVDIYPSS